jgi:hypothetical protein
MTIILATVLGVSDFATIAWLVIVLAGAITTFRRPSPDLDRVERKLDLLLKHHQIDPGNLLGTSEEVRILARSGDKVAAIKLHRELTGRGLAEAKADIEEYLRSAPPA